jgi:hypothetical protein
MVHIHIEKGKTTENLTGSCTVLWKANGKTTTFITFPEQSLSIKKGKCEVLPQVTTQFRGPLFPLIQISWWGERF